MDSIIYFLAGAGIVAVSYLLSLQLVKAFKAAALEAGRERHNEMSNWVADVEKKLHNHYCDYKHEKHTLNSPDVGDQKFIEYLRAGEAKSKLRSKNKKRGKRG